MGRLIRTIICFLLISAFVYSVAVIGIYKSGIKVSRNIPHKEARRSAFTARKFHEADLVYKTDIIILGSSLGYRNYDPKILSQNHFSSFTLGSSSQKPNLSLPIAKKYLDKIDTELVIVDVNPYLMVAPDSNESTDIIINSDFDYYDINFFFAEPSLIAFNALLIKYLGFAEAHRKEKIKDSLFIKEDSEYLGLGHATMSRSYDPKKNPVINLDVNKMKKHQKESLDELIALLKEKKIKYLLVFSPLNETYFKTSKISSKVFRKKSKEMFSIYGNYIDSNTIEQYQNDDFVDFSHLNKRGSEKFTKSLIPIIQKIKN